MIKVTLTLPFNSFMVQLQVMQTSLTVRAKSPFNSFMVQLQGLPCGYYVNQEKHLSIPSWYNYKQLAVNIATGEYNFQFLHGTITSPANRPVSTRKNVFQFLHGTITSLEKEEARKAKPAFNSFMVQLQGPANRPVSTRKNVFQFLHGTITRLR